MSDGAKDPCGRAWWIAGLSPVGVTNALNQTVSLSYSNGFLTNIVTGPTFAAATRFTWDARNRIRTISDSDGAPSHVFITDERLNTRATSEGRMQDSKEMTDTTGAVLARYKYDPYGRQTQLEEDSGADFGFTGHYHHRPSNLSLALFRAYNATLGLWLSRDPIHEGDGLNMYAYVGNRPTRATDAVGLSDFNRPPAAIVGASAIYGPPATFPGYSPASPLTDSQIATGVSIAVNGFLYRVQQAKALDEGDMAQWKQLQDNRNVVGLAGVKTGLYPAVDAWENTWESNLARVAQGLAIIGGILNGLDADGWKEPYTDYEMMRQLMLLEWLLEQQRLNNNSSAKIPCP